MQQMYGGLVISDFPLSLLQAKPSYMLTKGRAVLKYSISQNRASLQR